RGVAGWQKHCMNVKMLFLPATAITGIVLAVLQLPFTQYIYYGTMAALALVSIFSWRNLKEGGASCSSNGSGTSETVRADTGPDLLCKGIVPHDMFEIMMNGSFAFVMTVIIKNNLPLPHASDSDDWAYLAEYFSSGVFGDLVSFLFMFTIFAILYILFFEMLRNIRALDRYFVYLSFGFVLALIFMPLTSLLYAVTDMPVPYGILFHANVLVTGLVMIVLWKHASARQRLLYPATDPLRVDGISRRLYLFPATAAFCLFLDLLIPSYEILPETALYIVPCLVFFLLSHRC
ncbi:TMEM175 family protein, partial [Methanoregula sp.]|uniref:TMEM175 family protein n=1 Tax=Methanoregula sp. TaxID=2052170 RepID=UPI000CA74FFB